MNAKPFPWMCPDCRTKTVFPVERDYAVTVEHDGVAHDLVVSAVAVPTCSQCGQAIIITELSERVTSELRRAAGLLLPETIRTKREALGLTPLQLATALRVSESAFKRWEAGQQLQPRAVDLLMRLYFDSVDVRRACVA